MWIPTGPRLCEMASTHNGELCCVRHEGCWSQPGDSEARSVVARAVTGTRGSVMPAVVSKVYETSPSRCSSVALSQLGGIRSSRYQFLQLTVCSFLVLNKGGVSYFEFFSCNVSTHIYNFVFNGRTCTHHGNQSKACIITHMACILTRYLRNKHI